MKIQTNKYEIIPNNKIKEFLEEEDITQTT